MGTGMGPEGGGWSRSPPVSLQNSKKKGFAGDALTPSAYRRQVSLRAGILASHLVSWTFGQSGESCRYS